MAEEKKETRRTGEQGGSLQPGTSQNSNSNQSTKQDSADVGGSVTDIPQESPASSGQDTSIQDQQDAQQQPEQAQSSEAQEAVQHRDEQEQAERRSLFGAAREYLKANVAYQYLYAWWLLDSQEVADRLNQSGGYPRNRGTYIAHLQESSDKDIERVFINERANGEIMGEFLAGNRLITRKPGTGEDASDGPWRIHDALRIDNIGEVILRWKAENKVIALGVVRAKYFDWQSLKWISLTPWAKRRTDYERYQWKWTVLDWSSLSRDASDTHEAEDALKRYLNNPHQYIRDLMEAFVEGLDLGSEDKEAILKQLENIGSLQSGYKPHGFSGCTGKAEWFVKKNTESNKRLIEKTIAVLNAAQKYTKDQPALKEQRGTLAGLWQAVQTANDGDKTMSDELKANNDSFLKRTYEFIVELAKKRRGARS